MQSVVGRWLDDVMASRDPSEEWNAAQRQRYQAARRKLDEEATAAALVLPGETTEILSKLKKGLEQLRDGSQYWEVLDGELHLLGQTLEEIVSEGRRVLGAEIAKA